MRSPHERDKAAESQQHVPASAAVGTRGPIPTPAFGERVVGAAAMITITFLVLTWMTSRASGDDDERDHRVAVDEGAASV